MYTLVGQIIVDYRGASLHGLVNRTTETIARRVARGIRQRGQKKSAQCHVQ